jgi:glycosyltransferase involved in cell wall biosynthesis
MRIAFILPTLGAGGAERVASLLCNWWAEEGHAVELVTFEPEGSAGSYGLDERVSLRQITALNPGGELARVGTNWRRLAHIRARLKAYAPDVVVAFTTEANIVALLAARGLGVPVVISERNQPERPGLGRFTPLARRLTYPLAAALVVQTEAIAGWARARFGVPVHVLPNPVRLPSWQLASQNRAVEIVAAGRLVKQKGFDILIGSFAEIAASHPGWSLTIYGDGPDRTSLKEQIRALGLEDRVSLPGVTNDMASALTKAGLFVLASRYEGYPNVLVEALAASCPVVATDCPGAVAEILRGGKYGLLAPCEDKHALAAALTRAISDPGLRAGLSAQAREAVSGLDVDLVGRRWLALFETLRA